MPKKLVPGKHKSQLRKSASSERAKGLVLQKPQPPSTSQVAIKQETSPSSKRTPDGAVKQNLSKPLTPHSTAKKEQAIKTEEVDSLQSCSVVALSTDVQADNRSRQDNNGNSQLAVWRRTPHKSFDETRPKNDEGMGRFGWRRAHSQDSDAFLKQRKDSTNNAKAQGKLASPEEKLEWRKTYTVPKEEAFLGTTDVMKQAQVFAVDNRELDHKVNSPESREKGVMESGREKPPSPETERVNAVAASEDGTRSETSEISTENESLLTIQDLTPRVVDDYELVDSDSEVGDIMHETMPVMSGFTSMETSVSSSMGRSVHSMTKSGELLDQPDTKERNIKRETKMAEKPSEQEDLDLDMSLEEVQALEEAANMVVKSIKRDMSSSTLDDDMFIDNETLSLVSTEYASDTCSEVSLTLSSSSRASEVTSEMSNVSVPVARRGPRILKPGEKSTIEVKNEEETAKGIRGKRKGLYSAKSVAKPVNKPKETPARSSPRPAVAKPVVRPSTQKNSSVSTPPPSSANKKPAVKQANATAVVTPVKTPPKTAPKPAAKKTSPSDNSREPLSLGARSNTVIRKNPVEKPAVKPKPPTKQGTFVKDTPSSENAPTIDVDQNGNRPNASADAPKTPGRSSPPGGRSSPNQKKGNESKQGNAAKSWSKALGGHGFVVESPQKDATKQQQKNASQIGSTGARRPGSASPRSAASKTGAANKMGSVQTANTMAKTGSASSLNKTSSGSSLNKSAGAGSKSSLTKVGSGNNLKKAGSKSSLKQSDSNASLKKGNSRPSTPTGRHTPPSDGGRRSSTDSTPGKKTSTAGLVGKKQVNSKIAGLWKSDAPPSPVGRASPQTAGKTNPGSPHTTGKSSTPARSAKSTGRSGSPANRPPPAPPVRKSSLSSNSSSSSIGGTTSSKSSTSEGKNQTACETKKPDTLSRGRTFDKIARPSTTSKTNSPGKTSSNTWKKGKGQPKVSDPDVWVKRDSSTDSLSYTADSVSSIPSASSETSLTSKSIKSSEPNSPTHSEKLSKNSGAASPVKSPVKSPKKTIPKPVAPPKPQQNSIPNGQLTADAPVSDTNKTVRSPPLSPTMTSRKPQPGDNRTNSEPLSAIVQPFNYNPNQVKNNSSPEVALKNAVNSSNQPPESPKPLTKTEMLLARRKQSKKKPDDLPGDDDEAKKAGCLVTTV